MLLAVDVGNTQTVLGLLSGRSGWGQWRVATEPERTADELGVLIDRLLDLRGQSADDVDAACLSSTVPCSCASTRHWPSGYLGAPMLVLGPGVRTGIPILVDDPREVGPDRIANSVAALERYGAPCVVVDFGTATNFDAVSAEGEYVGGRSRRGSRRRWTRCSRVPRGSSRSTSSLPRAGRAQHRARASVWLRLRLCRADRRDRRAHP